MIGKKPTFAELVIQKGWFTKKNVDFGWNLSDWTEP